MFKKSIALVSAVSMLLSFAACGENEEHPTTTANSEDVVATDVVTNESGETVIVEDEETEKDDEKGNKEDKTEKDNEEKTTKKSDDKTTGKSEDGTTKKSDEKETTTKSDDKTTTKKETTTKKDSKPSTKKEIVEYYNKAVNKVKSDAKSVVQFYDNSTNYKGIVEAGGLSKLGKWLMDKFLKENHDRKEHKGNDAIVKAFPVEGQKKSNITPDVVKSAKCEDKGDYYEITLIADCSDKNPDVNPTRGGGKVGRMFNILEVKDVTDAVEGVLEISNPKFSYMGGELVAHIDKKTGNMTYLYTKLPMVLALEALNIDAAIGLQFENKWEINW